MVVHNIGVVGLGGVGCALVARLIERGFSVTVYDSRSAEVAAAVELGALPALLPADLAEAVDVVIVAAGDEATAEEVLFDHGGIGETLRSGGVVLDASATDALFRKRASVRLSRFGIRRIDVGRSVDEVISTIAA